MKKQPPNTKLEIIYLPVSSLVKLPGNPRKDVDPEAINKLAALIKAHGFQNPLNVYQENGKHLIIAGNHRFDSGLSLGMTEFPCLIYTGDKKAALARAVSDNKSNAWTDWDFPSLKDMLTELDGAGNFDMFTTGFEQGELDEMFGVVGAEPADSEPQIDRAEELNKVWKVKTGDLFQIASHRLLCGDSCRAEDVARVMGGEKADMVVTDPPYGISNEEFRSSLPQSKGKGDRRAIVGDDDCDSVALLFKNLQGDAVIWGANNFPQLLPHKGRWICWDKRLTEDADRMLGSAFELAWTSKTSGFDKMIRCLHGGVVNADKGKRMHPTQKPIQVMTESIEQFPGLIILDPFLGSGTTMVACQNLNRKCRGIEISPDYCAVICQRMTDAFPGIEIKRIEKE